MRSCANFWASAGSIVLPKRSIHVGTEELNRNFAVSLSQYLADNFAVNVGQPPLDSVVAECQSLMIDAEQMQNRGVQIITVGLPSGALIAKLVALTMAVPQPRLRPRPAR